MIASEIARKIVRSLGLRVSRDRPWNRFQSVDECLLRMRALGYQPRVVIDVGANRGQFHRLVRPIFPSARYHLVEPQPACAKALRSMAGTLDAVEVHHVALSEPGVETVRLLGVGQDGGSTGAYVAKGGERDEHEILVPAMTLDDLMSERLSAEERCLLKLDVESHELSVLRGSVQTMSKVEALLLEVSFYDVGGRGDPTFSEVSTFLDRHGFILYDIASLSGRPRDDRLRQGDVIFVRRDTALVSDSGWG